MQISSLGNVAVLDLETGSAVEGRGEEGRIEMNQWLQNKACDAVVTDC